MIRWVRNHHNWYQYEENLQNIEVFHQNCATNQFNPCSLNHPDVIPLKQQNITSVPTDGAVYISDCCPALTTMDGMGTIRLRKRDKLRKAVLGLLNLLVSLNMYNAFLSGLNGNDVNVLQIIIHDSVHQAINR